MENLYESFQYALHAKWRSLHYINLTADSTHLSETGSHFTNDFLNKVSFIIIYVFVNIIKIFLTPFFVKDQLLFRLAVLGIKNRNSTK